MGRIGNVYCSGLPAGFIEELPAGYVFTYNTDYLTTPGTKSISMTLPKRKEPYTSPTLFPFFFGLLAEGILKETQCRKLKLDENDHFGRLLKTANSDTIGCITVTEKTES